MKPKGIEKSEPQHPLLEYLEYQHLPLPKQREAKGFYDLARCLAYRTQNPGLDQAMDYLLKAQIAFTQPGEPHEKKSG